MDISGNTILITGGGSGIGKALARELHEAGNKVIIAGRRQAVLDAVVEQFPGMAAMAFDMGDATSIADLAARLLVEHPTLNAVIHNAGVMLVEEAIDLPIAEATVATNLLGPIRLTHALLPHFLAQPKAAILTVSSGLAFVPLVATPTYDATKAGIHGWSMALREQLRGTGVEVIEIVPPGVQTDLMPGHAHDPQMMPLDAFIEETMGLLRQQPTPDEICVERVMFLRGADRRRDYDQVFATLNGLG